MSSVLQTCISQGWGGLEMVALEMAHDLNNSGHSTTTFAAQGSKLSQKLDRDHLLQIEVSSRKYFAPRTVLTLRKYLKRHNPSAVIVQHLSDLWFVVPALASFPHIRLFGISHTFVQTNKKDYLHRKLYRRMDKLIALTPRQETNLLEKLPITKDQVVIIPNAVDVENFGPEMRNLKFRSQILKGDQNFLIGVVSRLDQGKGLLEALEACRILDQQNLPFHMVFIGTDTVNSQGMSQELQRLVEKWNLSKRVTLAGHREDISAAMASLDLLLMPAPGETFGRVIIEAMASGVPIVATTGGGLPDIVKEGELGLLVKSGDSKGMAESIRKLFADPSLRKQMAERGVETAKKTYNRKLILEKLLETFSLTPNSPLDANPLRPSSPSVRGRVSSTII